MNFMKIALKSKSLLKQFRWIIVLIILMVLAFEIVGFIFKWAPFIFHPPLFINSYHNIISDLFSILVTYEIFDLLYTLSPSRLTDVVLLAIARKIVLASSENGLIQTISAFSVLLLVRLAWYAYDQHQYKKKSNSFE